LPVKALGTLKGDGRHASVDGGKGRCNYRVSEVDSCGVEEIMAEAQEGESGFVVCTRCNGDGEGCDLKAIPELAEDCSTMLAVKAAGGGVEFAADGATDGEQAGIQAPELPYDWSK
jgi:hypothetical protein